MRRKDGDIRDEVLASKLRDALLSERAPEAWVQVALQVPSHEVVLDAPRRVSPLLGIIPHLSGLALLLGLIAAVFFRPEALGSIGNLLKASLPSVPLLFEGVSPSLLLAMLSTPVLIYVLYQGSRGFPILHRMSAHR